MVFLDSKIPEEFSMLDCNEKKQKLPLLYKVLNWWSVLVWNQHCHHAHGTYLFSLGAP